MRDNDWTRRRFLQSAVVLGGAGLAACARNDRPPEVHATNAIDRSSAAMYPHEERIDSRLGVAKPRPVYGDPIHMTAQAIAQPGSSGNIVAARFKPPAGRKLAISSIKFQIQPSVFGSLTAALLAPWTRGAAGYALGNGYALGAVVGVAFSLIKLNASAQQIQEGNASHGTFPAMVPIAALCDGRNLAADLLTGLIAAAGTQGSTMHPISEYRWDLPEAFVVPDGFVLVPQFFNYGGNVGPAGGTLQQIPALQIQVSYEGSLLDPSRYGDQEDEGIVRVPYAACYQAPRQTIDNLTPTTYALVSDETALINPFDEEVSITQINGKIFTQPECNDWAVDADQAIQIRMITGNHWPLVRDPSIFRVVFPRETRAWAMQPFQFPPGDYINVTLGGLNALFSLASGCIIQPMVAITGYREVRAEKFAEGSA